jgi:hypothetical protein
VAIIASMAVKMVLAASGDLYRKVSFDDNSQQLHHSNKTTTTLQLPPFNQDARIGQGTLETQLLPRTGECFFTFFEKINNPPSISAATRGHHHPAEEQRRLPGAEK